jgi:hypothetical protein
MKKTNLDEREDKKKGIRSVIILEMIGKPKEYILEKLEELIKQMDEEKGVSVISKKINEPIVMENNKEFYTTFAEIELEVEDILYLSIIMFKYMPAHIEVLEPELIALTNNGWTDILSELTRRLHGYDEIARVMQLQAAQMQKKINELTLGKKEPEKELPKKDSEDKPSKSKKK